MLDERITAEITNDDDDGPALSLNAHCVIAKDNSDIFQTDLQRNHMVSWSWISPELYGRTMGEEIHKIVNNYQDCC